MASPVRVPQGFPGALNAGAAKTKEIYTVKGQERYLTPVVYFDLNANYLNEFDQIARLLMATMWSSQFDPTNFLQQNLVGQGTLAVARSGEMLYVTGNDCFPPDLTWGKLRKSLEEALANQGVQLKIFFFENPNGVADRSFHAEAQLVWYLHQNGIDVYGRTIGVSKPCCRKCAEMLDRVGLAFSYWHDEVPPGWTDPGVPAKAFVEKKS